MCTISQMQKRLRALNVTKIAERAVNDTKEYAAAELRYQWSKGQGGNGPFPDYSRASVEKYGKTPGPWRLYDKGSLSRGVFVKAKNGMVEMFSTDSKANMIEAKLSGEMVPMGLQGKDYGPFKLNAESWADYKPVLQSALIEEAKSKLQL